MEEVLYDRIVGPAISMTRREESRRTFIFGDDNHLERGLPLPWEQMHEYQDGVHDMSNREEGDEILGLMGNEIVALGRALFPTRDADSPFDLLKEVIKRSPGCNSRVRWSFTEVFGLVEDELARREKRPADRAGLGDRHLSYVSIQPYFVYDGSAMKKIIYPWYDEEWVRRDSLGGKLNVSSDTQVYDNTCAEDLLCNVWNWHPAGRSTQLTR